MSTSGPSTTTSTSASEPSASASEPVEIEVGAKMRCEWRDGELRDCEVLEYRLSGSVPQYYVHYVDFNRRLDEWVRADRLHPLPTTGRSTGERKRKLDPAVAGNPVVPLNPHDEAAAGELDAATQREHEAATRVKNINTIVLGKWEIQTWCGALPQALRLSKPSSEQATKKAFTPHCSSGIFRHFQTSIRIATPSTFASAIATSPSGSAYAHPPYTHVPCSPLGRQVRSALCQASRGAASVHEALRAGAPTRRRNLPLR